MLNIHADHTEENCQTFLDIAKMIDKYIVNVKTSRDYYINLIIFYPSETDNTKKLNGFRALDSMLYYLDLNVIRQHIRYENYQTICCKYIPAHDKIFCKIVKKFADKL